MNHKNKKKDDEVKQMITALLLSDYVSFIKTST